MHSSNSILNTLGDRSAVEQRRAVMHEVDPSGTGCIRLDAFLQVRDTPPFIRPPRQQVVHGVVVGGSASTGFARVYADTARHIGHYHELPGHLQAKYYLY